MLAFTANRTVDSIRLIPLAFEEAPGIIPIMEQRITHACGHEQVHYLAGFPSQQERKARWLGTTTCRTCFAAAKRSEQADAAARDTATIAHLTLPALLGSERQVGWATTIRASRLAVIVAEQGADASQHACLEVTDAKWWIDHRDLPDADLIAKATLTAAARTGQLDATPLGG